MAEPSEWAWKKAEAWAAEAKLWPGREEVALLAHRFDAARAGEAKLRERIEEAARGEERLANDDEFGYGCELHEHAARVLRELLEEPNA